MGSTGTGSLTDYANHPTKSSNQGGSSGEDQCKKSFYTLLEDVQTCSYFMTHGNVPPLGTAGSVVFVNPRFGVQDGNGLILGYLPTKYNYIKTCMSLNIGYAAVVSFSGMAPVPSIGVDVSPI